MNRQFKSVRRAFTAEEKKRFEEAKRWAQKNRAALQRDADEQFDQMETAFRAMRLLKQAREQRGVSLSELAERTGIDKSNLSKLENDINANPTLETLLRIARAIGGTLEFSFRDAA